MNWFPRWRSALLLQKVNHLRSATFHLASSLSEASPLPSLKLLYLGRSLNVLHSVVEAALDRTLLERRKAFASPSSHVLCPRVDVASCIRHLHSSPSSQGAASKLKEALVDSSEEPADSKHDIVEPRSTPSAKILQLVSEIANLTLLEASDLSYLLKKSLGLPDSAMPYFGGGAAVAVGGAPTIASVEEEKKPEKTNFDIKLEKFDASAKIKIIKEVRTFTSLGLKEAKELVEKLPAVLKKGVAKEEAEQIIEKLKAVGATVVLE